MRGDPTWKSALLACADVFGWQVDQPAPQRARKAGALLSLYHGESIEHVSDVLDVSRRTGYRAHMRGLYMLSCIFSGYLSKTNAPSVLNTNEKNQEKVE
jgi:hypothetical protein